MSAHFQNAPSALTDFLYSFWVGETGMFRHMFRSAPLTLKLERNSASPHPPLPVHHPAARQQRPTNTNQPVELARVQGVQADLQHATSNHHVVVDQGQDWVSTTTSARRKRS
jgi:hypothetical protein